MDIPEQLLAQIPPERRSSLTAVLAQDPRPAYQRDPQRQYGLSFAGLEVHFSVCGDRLTVCSVEKAHP